MSGIGKKEHPGICPTDQDRWEYEFSIPVSTPAGRQQVPGPSWPVPGHVYGVRRLWSWAATLSQCRARADLLARDPKTLLLEVFLKSPGVQGQKTAVCSQVSPTYTSYNSLRLAGAKSKTVARSRFPSLLSVPRGHNLTKTTLRSSVSSGSNPVPPHNFLLFSCKRLFRFLPDHS